MAALSSSSLVRLPGVAPKIGSWLARWLPGLAALLATLVLAVYAARLFWLLMPLPASAAWVPAPPQRSSGPVARAVDLGAIGAAHLFGAYQAPGAPAQSALAAAPETTLSLQLLGVWADHNHPEASRALIQPQGGDEQPYAIGDDVVRGATLKAIFADRVVLSRNGRLETLRLDKDRAGSVSAATATTAAPGGEPSGAVPNLGQIRQRLLADPSKAADYIRVQPAQAAGGGLNGYRIFPGRDQSLFTGAGLKAGDVVTAVNGQRLNDPSRALQMLSELSQTPQVTITVERGGQPLTVSLNLSP